MAETTENTSKTGLQTAFFNGRNVRVLPKTCANSVRVPNFLLGAQLGRFLGRSMGCANSDGIGELGRYRPSTDEPVTRAIHPLPPGSLASAIGETGPDRPATRREAGRSATGRHLTSMRPHGHSNGPIFPDRART